MDASAEIRAQIKTIQSELYARNVHSRTIEDATYAIETLCMAYVASETPVNWRDLYGMTKAERRIAELLHKRIGNVVSHEAIMDAVFHDNWDGYAHITHPNKLRQVYLFKVRLKLKNSPFDIETDFGVGYKMVLKPSALALTALQELQAH